MARRLAALFASRSSWFDLGVFAVGLLMVGYYASVLVRDGTSTSWLYLLAIPLVALIARFPVVLDRREGGIEVGVESAILMFLLCMAPPGEALVLWAVSVLVSQATTAKRTMAKVFNVGVGMLGAGVSATIFTAASSPRRARSNTTEESCAHDRRTGSA